MDARYKELELHAANWYHGSPERARADVALYVLGRPDLTPEFRILAEDIDHHFAALMSHTAAPSARQDAATRRQMLEPVMTDTETWPAAARMVLWYGNSLL